MTASYDFGDRLRMSAGHAACADVRSVLMGQIPGAANVIQASKSNDRGGVDWWVEHVAGKFLGVDAKVRGEDYSAHPDPKRRSDDLALETWSVVQDANHKGKPGWTLCGHRRTDYVLWLWTDTRRFCLLPFPMLCGVFQRHWQRWAREFKTARQWTPPPFGDGYGWHSECVFVPRCEVWAMIYLQYGDGSAGVGIKPRPGPFDLS